MSQEYERVYTVNTYYDGPRHGVADFCGSPHVYRNKFDDYKNDGTNTFYLKPVEQETLRMILEDWAIWNCWRKAFDTGDAKIDSHPALPKDKTRHEELKPFVDAAMTIDAAHSITVRGEFTVKAGEWQVRWITFMSPTPL